MFLNIIYAQTNFYILKIILFRDCIVCKQNKIILMLSNIMRAFI